MFVLLTISVLVCLMHAYSLEEPINNRCGQDFSIWKKLLELEQKVTSLKEDANAKCKNVAFRAQLTKSLGSVTLGQKIVYDGVELNNGKAYHPFHGVFTAPCDGIYMFSITIGSANKQAIVHLKKNDVTIEYGWAGFNLGWDMGGVTTVVQLNAGDDVWVEGKGTINGAKSHDGVGTQKHTGFAGALINAL